MSVFWIKIIAAASMLLDHTGMILFPEAAWMRILGRLALPLYALCIAEGFRHTRSRVKYFLRIFILGALCQVVYFLASEQPYLGILITFSLSIVLLFLLDALLMACKDYFATTGRRISFEYTLIRGKNDSVAAAEQLANVLNSRLRSRTDTMPIHVNLIPVNPVEETGFDRSDDKAIKAFAAALEKKGVRATVRRRLGADINAACGQLRRADQKSQS